MSVMTLHSNVIHMHGTGSRPPQSTSCTITYAAINKSTKTLTQLVLNLARANIQKNTNFTQICVHLDAQESILKFEITEAYTTQG